MNYEELLEKQKLNTSKREIDDAYLQGICDAKHEIEKQGEQSQLDYEHADIPQKDFAPIEPKFEVGDWLQYRYAEPFLVEEITEQGYCNGDSCLPFEWEDEIHLWTIQDANDGDVLVTTSARNCPFIYRKTDHNNNLAYFYAGINGNGNFCEGCIKRTLYHFGSASNVAPATKEQRDLLFAKMREDGYEWDADKKEVKKIKPKMLNADEVIEWLHDHIQVDEPKVEYSTDGQPLAESFFAHAKARCIAADEVVKQFKEDFGL